MDTDFIAIGKRLIRLEEVFLDRLQTIERSFMTTAADLQAAVQASNDAIANLTVSVDKLIGLASSSAATLAAALKTAAVSGQPVSDAAITHAIESLRAGAAAATAEGEKVNAAIAADSPAPVLAPASAPAPEPAHAATAEVGTAVAPAPIAPAVPETTPPADDAFVAIGATRFSDGQIQTAETLAAAQALHAAAHPAPTVA